MTHLCVLTPYDPKNSAWTETLTEVFYHLSSGARISIPVVFRPECSLRSRPIPWLFMDWLLVSPDHRQASCRMGPCIPCPQLPALYQCWVMLEHADIFLHFLETVHSVNGYDIMHIKHKHHLCNDALTWSHCDLRYCFEMKRLHRHDTT